MWALRCAVVVGLTVSLLSPVRAAAQTVDVAAGKTVTASAIYAGYVGSNLVDGNDSSRAITTSTQPSWLRVDLASALTIHSFRVVGYDTGGGMKTLQWSSDGTAWNQAYGDIVGNVTTTGTFATPITARYWRMLANGSGSYLDLGTLNLYELNAVTTTSTSTTSTTVGSSTTTTSTSTTVGTTTTTQPPITAVAFEALHRDVLGGLALLVFLAAAFVVGNWGRRA